MINFRNLRMIIRLGLQLHSGGRKYAALIEKKEIISKPDFRFKHAQKHQKYLSSKHNVENV